MKKNIFLTLLSIFSLVFSEAQTIQINIQIKNNSDQQTLSGATVSIFENQSNNQLANAVTDSNGKCSITLSSEGKYKIISSSVGYKEQITDINTIEKKFIEILMQRTGSDLSTVTVISKAPPVTQKGDTTQYSANQYQVNPDATAEDLIKKMPAITVDKSGAVTAQGEQVKKVTVDGKDFFGDDATSALRNLPANVVDKIQVYDRLSDQAQLTGIDDGNSQKSINIITKAGIQNAQFGRVFAGIGNDNKYSGGGNVSFFKNDRRISLVGNFNNVNQQNFGSQDLLGITGNSNQNRFPGSAMGGGRGPGGMGASESFSIGPSNGISTTNAIGINYSDKWGKSTTVTGSYFFNNSHNDNFSLTNTRIIEGGQTTLQQSDALSDNFNHRINARVEIKLDSNDMLFIIPNLSFQTNKSDKNGWLKSYVNTDDSLYNTQSGSISNKNGYNLRNNIMYRHSFKKKGRVFSLGFNSNFTKNNGVTEIDGLYRFYDQNGFPVIPDSLQQQNSDSKTDGYNLGANISYNEPLDKKGVHQLQIEYNPSYQNNRANQLTYSFDGNSYNQFDSMLSNKFDNDIFTHNGGLTYRKNPSKDEQFSIGINIQSSQLKSIRTFPGSSQIDYTFKNLLPNASWRKKISKYANIRMFYRASTNFPSINQLQDVVNLSNPLNVSSGNKELKQSYTHFLGGRYTYTNTQSGRSFFTGLFMQASSNYISNATYIIQSDSTIQQGIILKKGSQFTQPINLNGYKNGRAFITYSTPVKFIKSNLSFNAIVVYSSLPGLINYQTTQTDNWQYTIGSVIASNINEYIDYNITYNANINRSATTGTTTTTNNYANQTLSATINLLSKKGWFISNELNYQSYQGLSSGFNQEFILWNASIGRKFLKNKTAEIRLSVFDLLKQNQSISRNITNTYIEDAQSVVLQQYFMLTFSYNLKNFGKPKKQEEKQEDFIQPVGYPGRH